MYFTSSGVKMKQEEGREKDKEIENRPMKRENEVEEENSREAEKKRQQKNKIRKKY